MPLGERAWNGDAPTLSLEYESHSTRIPLLFMGDLHWDHPRTDRNAMRRVLNEAVERDAWIVLLGDTFCAMQGKYDRRGTKEAVRPEHQRDDYFTALTETAAEWFKPYAKHIWLVLDGNHESAVKKNHEVDLVKHFVDALGEPILRPGYTTYALVRFKRQNQQATAPIWLGHGSGGNSPVTKGTISAQRRAVMYPDARVLVTGHIHNQWYVAHPQLRVNKTGKITSVLQEHFSVGTFKDDYGGGKGGWAVEKGFGPTVPSVWWSEWWLNIRRGVEYTFTHEVLR